jgi:class 3 adenylate cyclase
MSATRDSTADDPQQTIADLKRQLAERTAELAARNSEYGERIQHQAAANDVLKVMSASPADPQPVFDLIVERARDLCGGYGVTVFEFDGALIHWRAATGVSDDPVVREAYEAMFPMAPTRELPPGLAIIDRQVIHIRDTETEPGLNPAIRHITAKSIVTVPLMRGEVAIGALSLGSRKRGGFSGSQIELLQTFAEQAVITITSAETYRELRQRTGDLQEALEQQTATAEVLQFINSSPGDLAPVFDAMLEKAIRLCDAVEGVLWTINEGRGRVAAARGLPANFVASLAERGQSGTHPHLERVMRGEHLIHVPDTMQFELYGRGLGQAAVEAGVRTLIWVALVKNGAAVGAFAIGRREVRPFTDKQIALLQNFAAQAVIAMENARLLGELRDRNNEIAGWNRELETRVAAQLAELERTGKLRRFLAPQLADLIVAEGNESILESHRREIVVVFCDVRGFTAFAERAEPEEVMAFLRDYHTTLGPIVARFEGTLDHYSGDGIMVFFNDPLPTPEPAKRAIEMAVAMREAAQQVLKTWRRHGHDLGFGVGISQGYATLGQIGFAERMDYTAIGTVTNLAARLCSEAKDGQILIIRRVAVAVEDDAKLEEIGDVSLKGLSQAVAVYNVVQ